jgi:hypothetical protein
METTVEAPPDFVRLTLEHVEFLDEADDGEDVEHEGRCIAPN